MSRAGTADAVQIPTAPPGIDADVLARDEGYWSRVAALYDIARDPVPLENGYWGVMAIPVQAAYLRHQQRVNQEGPAFARRIFPSLYRDAHTAAAQALALSTDELALTRNASEALQALIAGYNRLRPGDAVLCADVDYDSMLTAIRWLRQRRGVQVVEIEIPEPATRQGILDAYAQAFERHSTLRMMLLTQVSHRHGLRMPVVELSAMARQRGIDVILDAAHGVGQIDMRLADEGPDFIGVNFHKWLGAPLGIGGLYIRQGRVADIDPYMGEPDPQSSVAARVHTGTINFASVMTLPDALKVHAAIGVARKQARLRYLSSRWIDVARRAGSYEVLAAQDMQLRSAIAAFRVRGNRSMAQNQQLAAHLLDHYRLHTITRDGLASGACVRVTPAVFTRLGEVDRLGEALLEMAGRTSDRSPPSVG